FVLRFVIKMSSNSGGLERLKQKLNRNIEDGNHYEAHQLYNTLFYRLGGKNLHSEAQDLVATGAFYLFEHKKFGSAAQLCLLYVESLENHVRVVDGKRIDILGKMHATMPKELPELEAFESRVINWSLNIPESPKRGTRNLRHKFAMNYWEEKLYEDSRYHFLYSGDGKAFAKMLIEFAGYRGRPEEFDLFLTQAVLQTLCLNSSDYFDDCTVVAETLFQSYVELNPKISLKRPFAYPILNFLYFLLITIKKKHLPTFTFLCEVYQPSLRRDFENIRYLEKIGQEFFGVKSQSAKPGFFENLMQNLFVDDTPEPQDVKTTTSMTEED
uniref:Golgi to ER traffic protein 4 homolog n=1 Tax=Ciona savignyi TaxID=51511 RepID=H2Z249_CIOSA